MPGTIEEMRDLDVLDPEGRPTRLGDLWAQGPAVLVFTRHFG